ncbi:MAG: serine protease [Bacteroidota bacterium]
MEKIIEQYKAIITQIATPYSTGTGFYCKEHQLIITNEHVVRDNRQVIIDGLLFERQLSEVLYIDQEYDLAFLAAPSLATVAGITLNADQKLTVGQPVVAIGHPFSMQYAAAQGTISDAQQTQGGIDYIDHSATLPPGNSGGPLVNAAGEVIGINTFMIRDGQSTGFSLPVHYLLETIKAYKAGDDPIAARCTNCSTMVFARTQKNDRCPNCGSSIVLPSSIPPFEPFGVAKTIEDMLVTSGHRVELSRRGPSNWEIKEGSAHINISYHEQSGLIIGDAYLCSLPPENIKPLYEFLLKQNYEIEGLTFSVKGQDIVLSLLIYDRYLNVDTGVKLFSKLFAKADYYDNILVDNFGAVWKKEGITSGQDVARGADAVE